MSHRSITSLAHILTKPPLYNLTFYRNYAFKSDLKIKWVRPEKIPCTKPQKSGDLEPITEVPSKEYLCDFKNSKELENASDIVKKLFSLEFAPRSEIVRAYKEEMISKVRRHPLDKDSIEVKIAGWTGTIRSMQETLEQYPRDPILKKHLKELIDKRKKRLKFLRMWDYKKFEWLIEKLNIVYKPCPLENYPVTRKESLRKLTKIYCDDVKTKKLDAYKKQLQEEQPAFLREKIRTLEYIRKEQQELGIPITVEQEEIVSARKLLTELEEKRAQAQ